MCYEKYVYNLADKFTRKEATIGNKTSNKVEINTKETTQKKTSDLDDNPTPRKVKHEATSTFKKAMNDLELEASIDEVVEEDLNAELGNIHDRRPSNGGRSNDATEEEIQTDDDSYIADDVDEDDNEDDDIFGNIQADASDLIKAFAPEKDSQNNVSGNLTAIGSNDHHHHHQNIEQTNKAAFTFNADVGSSKTKDNPFHAKVKVKVMGHSKSPFHATEDGKRMHPQRKKASRFDDDDDDDDDDDIVEEESIKSYDNNLRLLTA